jgi:cytochrome c oxidase subunit 4
VDVHLPAGVPDVNPDCVEKVQESAMDAVQIALADQVAEQHRHHGKAQFLYVWAALLIMTGIEVYLAYQNMDPIRMLSILMGLSILKAGLIIAYFMHMKFEISRMKWLTMSSLVFCLAMMLVFLPDAFRILHLGVR